MERLRFLLSSEQLELLLAFESASGLGHLAEQMAKDPSVVSRNLQRLAETRQVLVKVRGRWEITPLGIQINQQTRAFLEAQNQLMSQTVSHLEPKPSLCNDTSILLIINAQNGLFDATQEGRNNSEAERNIALILNHWRSRNRRVIHVKHVSENPQSIFYRESLGVNFLDALSPRENEIVVEKTRSSAFEGTNLEAILSQQDCSDVVLTGFTANECIDATARDATARGLSVLVAGDATASFDLRDRSGRLVKADRIHKLTLLNINAFYAKVLNTNEVLS